MEWLFRPFQDVAFGHIATWWFATLIAMLLVAGILIKLGVEMENDVIEFYEEHGATKFILVAAVLAPLLEELIFRGIPHFFVGTLTALLFGSIVWVLLHEKRAFVIAPSIPLYVKLWAGGFWQEAILVHTIHNGLLVALLILLYPHISDLD